MRRGSVSPACQLRKNAANRSAPCTSNASDAASQITFTFGAKRGSGRKPEAGFGHELLGQRDAVATVTGDTEKQIHRAGGRRDFDSRHFSQRINEKVA